MSRFKPTTLIALDPYATAFTQGVCQQLERYFPTERGLVQTRTVIYQGTEIILSKELTREADFDFDLRNQHSSEVPTTGLLDSEQQIQGLKQDLIRLLRQGRNQNAIAIAQAQGIEVSKERRLYFIISSVNPHARGIIRQFAQLIHWLFKTLLTGESYTLEAVVLMPGLFVDPESVDYGNAYALLKELEQSEIREAVPVFENHWLLDNYNAHGIQMGFLPDALISYADTFVGFLTAEAEPVSVLVNTKVAQGKMSAYSTFGYAELVFPKDILLTRLSTALGRDILQQEFLAEEEHSPEHYRRLLLEVKAFILSDDYNHGFRDLEQPQGKRIWQDFSPQLTLRPGMVEEYVREMQHQHSQFKSKSLLGFKNTLENAREQVQKNLEAILNQKINHWVDATPTGLNRALQLLSILINRLIAPQADILGESPQNFIIQQWETAANLDLRLEVTINTEETQALLTQIQDLSNQLSTLEEKSEREPEELAELQNSLKTAYEEYAKALEAQEHSARQTRREAAKNTRSKLLRAVHEIEEKIFDINRRTEVTKNVLEEMMTERREVLIRRLVLHPSIIVLCLLLVAIVAVWLNFWSTISASFIGLCIVIFIGWAISLGLSLQQISHDIKKMEKQIERLHNSLKAAIAKLRFAHNKQLRLEYELYAQKLKEGIADYLIKLTKSKFSNIRQTLAQLQKIKNRLVQKHETAIPESSFTRRSVVSVENIDAYYRTQVVSQISQEVKASKKQGSHISSNFISRSQVLTKDLQEFSQQLDSFCCNRFEFLGELSICDILLHSPDLIDSATAQRQLDQLSEAAEPLLQLHQVDVNQTQTQSQDHTLWVAQKDRELVLDYFSKVCPQVTTQITNENKKLQLLSRCIGFPAYCISSIEFYGDCYEQNQIEPGNKSLPDLIPLDDNIQQVWREVLIAIALNLITREESQQYRFQEFTLGVKRRQIAESFANDFTKQSLYNHFSERLDSEIQQEDDLYDKLQSLQKQEFDLDNIEIEILTSLLQDYNPLN